MTQRDDAFQGRLTSLLALCKEKVGTMDAEREQHLRLGVAEAQRAVAQLRGEVNDVRRRVERLLGATQDRPADIPLAPAVRPGIAVELGAGAEALASSDEVLQHLKGAICAELGTLDPAEVERITAEEIIRRIHDLRWPH